MWDGFNKEYLQYFLICNKINIEQFCIEFKINKEIVTKFLSDDISLTIKELLQIAEATQQNVYNLFKQNIISKNLTLN